MEHVGKLCKAVSLDRRYSSMLLTCLLIAFGGGNGAFAQNENCVLVQKVDSAIAVDGRFDDAAWQGKSWNDGFVTLGLHGPTQHPTRFKCAYDDYALYFAFECAELKDDLHQDAVENDGTVWFDSAVEVFFKPDPQPYFLCPLPEGLRHVQLIFNPLGTTFEQYGLNGPASWEPVVQVVTSVGEKQWRAEVRILMLDVSPHLPEHLTVWQGQIGRSAFHHDQVERSTIFPGHGLYRTESNFGKMVFLEHPEDNLDREIDRRSVINPLLATFQQALDAISGCGNTSLADTTEALTAKMDDLLTRFDSANSADYASQREGFAAAFRTLVDTALDVQRVSVEQILATSKQVFGLASHPAITDSRRMLPDFIPDPQQLGSTVKMRLCRNEFEAGSFVIWPTEALKNVMVTVSDLTTADGQTVSSSVIDVDWVKCWYQAGSTSCYKSGNFLTPELLLNNPDLVQVDFENQCNILEEMRGPENAKIFYRDDATELMPLQELPRHFAQQVWLTANVGQDAAAGLYGGTIEVVADGGIVEALPIELEVLDFELRPSNLDSGLYHLVSLWCEPWPEERALAEMQNMADHGISNPGFRCEDPCYLLQIVPMMKQAGLDTKRIFALNYKLSVNDDLVGTPVEWADDWGRRWAAAAAATGVDEIYTYLVCEMRTQAKFDVERPIAQAIRRHGVKTWVACYPDYFPMAGDFIDMPVFASSPVSRELVDKVHARGGRVSCYANPQAGVERPEIYRRNFGLLLWQAGYDNSMNFLYWGGYGNPWDDFDTPNYRDHNTVYPTENDVIDTIQWEGWREGVDDCRYMATLEYWIERGIQINETGAVAEAIGWLVALRNGDATDLVDLDIVRHEIIGHIVACRRQVLAGKQVVAK